MPRGRRQTRQIELFISTAQLAQGLGHHFYTKLKTVLADAEFLVAFFDDSRVTVERRVETGADVEQRRVAARANAGLRQRMSCRS